MSVTAADIKSRFPELASIDSTTITRWIEEAERNHNAECWSGKSDDALAYLTAHFLIAFAGDGCGGSDLGPGPLSGASEGSVSASWSPLNIPKIFGQDDLGTTKYGRRYLSMQRSVFCCRCT